MGSIVGNFVLRAGVDFSAFTKESQKASKAMQSMNASISSAASRINRALNAVGIGLSVASVVAAGKAAVQAYKDESEASAKLSQVMKTTMGAADGEIRAIKQLTEAQEQLGIVGADVQQAGAQELATYLSSARSLETLIPVMNDMVAQQYGYSASAEQAANIATMLGKVIEGQTGGLSRYGYYFDDAQKKILKYGTEAERVATLAEIVEGSVGGMNFALANTPVGRMQQLSNTMGNIKVQFGEAIVTVGTVFLPVLNKVANLLANIASLAMRVAQAIANIFGKKISPSTAAVAGGAGDAAESFDDMAESAGGAGKAAKEAAKSVLGFDELNKLTDNKSTSGGGGGISGGGAGAISGLAEVEEEAAESATWLERALQRVKDLVESLDFGPLKASWDAITESARHLGTVILDYLGAAWDNVMVPLAHWTIEELIPAQLDWMAQELEFLAAVLERLKPTAKWLWQNLLQPLAEFAFDVIIDALEYMRRKLSDLTDLISGKTTFKDWLDTLTPLETVLGSIGAALLVVSVVTALWNGTARRMAKAVDNGVKAFELLTSKTGLTVLAVAAVVLAGIWLYKNWDTIKEKAQALWDKVKECWEGIKTSINEKVDAIKEKFGEFKTSVQEKFASIKAYFESLGDKWAEKKESIAEGVEHIKEKFAGFGVKVNGVVTTVRTYFELLQAKWQAVKDAIAGKIDDLKDKFDTCKDKVSDFVTNVKNFFTDLWNTVATPIQNIIDGVVSIFSGARDAVIQLGELFKADEAAKFTTDLGNGRTFNYNVHGSAFASGGFPDAGQLFVARESGPELVGSFGGNANAVANNDQIIAGIRQGVYEAVSSAMKNGNFSAKLYLDGHEVRSSLNRLDRAMGV